MPVSPVVTDALRDALALVGDRSTSPVEWRSQAVRVDTQVVAPLMLPAPSVDICEVQIAVPGHPPVRLRLYKPSGIEPKAAFLTFFGGAFRQGGLDYRSTDTLNRSRAAEAGILVAAVDYALAPEHPYPTALRQGQAALRWLKENSRDLDIDPTRIAIGGQSAGGNLAASVALANRRADGIPLALQLLEVPVLDLTGDHFQTEAVTELGIPGHLVEQDLMEMAALYLGGADPREETASPLLSVSLAGMPPAHVFTADLDVLRGDGQAYVEALQSAGVSAKEHRYAGMDHGSLFYTKDLPQARAWNDAVIDILRGLRDASNEPQPGDSQRIIEPRSKHFDSQL